MIGVEVKIPDIRKLGERLLPTQRDMRELAIEARTIIQHRTDSGRDVDGNDFEPYSPGYLKYKQKRNAPTQVTLRDHGIMRNSMDIKDITNGAAIYFNDAEGRSRAYWHQTGAGNLPERKFFGLSKDEVSTLTQRLFQWLRARAAK